MPGVIRRAGAVGVGLMWAWLAGPAYAQAPAAAVVPDVLPAVTAGAEPVKDLTPPAFTEPAPSCTPILTETKSAFAHPSEEEGGLFGSVEYLLWRPRRGANDFAVANTTNGLATVGELKTLLYELQSGVRASIGYRMPGAWETLFSYTHLGSSADSRVLAGPGQVLFPTLTRPGLVDQAQSAAADASLQYNIYDLELAKRITVDEHFSGRVFGGLKFADIRNDLRAAYDGLDARQALVVANSSFYGTGPVFGLEGQFGGWKGFHVYTRVSGGLISGQANDPLVETNNVGQTTYVNLPTGGWKIVPTGTLAIGAGWQRRTVSVRFGYEVTNWIGLIDQPQLVDDISQGKLVTRSANLTLEGFVARLGWKF